MCRVFKVEGNMLFCEQSLFSRYKSTDIEHIVGEKVYCYVRVIWRNWERVTWVILPKCKHDSIQIYSRILFYPRTRKSDEDPVAPKSVDVFLGGGAFCALKISQDFSRPSLSWCYWAKDKALVSKSFKAMAMFESQNRSFMFAGPVGWYRRRRRRRQPRALRSQRPPPSRVR